MEEFMRLVKSKAKPMAVGGTLISGTLMAALAAAYVKAVNEGEALVVTCVALVNTACRWRQHVSMRYLLHVHVVPTRWRSYDLSHCLFAMLGSTWRGYDAGSQGSL